MKGKEPVSRDPPAGAAIQPREDGAQSVGAKYDSPGRKSGVSSIKIGTESRRDGMTIAQRFSAGYAGKEGNRVNRDGTTHHLTPAIQESEAIAQFSQFRD